MKFLIIDELDVHAFLDETKAIIDGKYKFKINFCIISSRISWEIKKPKWGFNGFDLKNMDSTSLVLWKIYLGYIILERYR